MHVAIPLLPPSFSSQCHLSGGSQYGGSAHLRPSQHSDLIRMLLEISLMSSPRAQSMSVLIRNQRTRHLTNHI